MKVHESITEQRLMEAIEENAASLSNLGFCIKCGEEADGVEPDARAYTCERCGEPGVYGAEEILLSVSGW